MQESDAPKVVILICDDSQNTRRAHIFLVEAMLDYSFGPQWPDIFHIDAFPDGRPALQFLQDRAHARGVILLTDGQMPDINGFQLVQTLFDRNLLPAHTVMISGNDIDEIKKSLPKEDGKPVICCIQKPAVLPEEMLTAWALGAAEEIGLTLQPPAPSGANAPVAGSTASCG